VPESREAGRGAQLEGPRPLAPRGLPSISIEARRNQASSSEKYRSVSFNSIHESIAAPSNPRVTSFPRFCTRINPVARANR